MHQLTKLCKSLLYTLRGYWPGNIENPSLRLCMTKGLIKQGRMGKHSHRAEMLILMELADLVLHKQYLQKGFATGDARAPDEGDSISACLVGGKGGSVSEDEDDGKGTSNVKGKRKGRAPRKSTTLSPLQAIKGDTCDCESFFLFSF